MPPAAQRGRDWSRGLVLPSYGWKRRELSGFQPITTVSCGGRQTYWFSGDITHCLSMDMRGPDLHVQHSNVETGAFRSRLEETSKQRTVCASSKLTRFKSSSGRNLKVSQRPARAFSKDGPVAIARFPPLTVFHEEIATGAQRKDFMRIKLGDASMTARSTAVSRTRGRGFSAPPPQVLGVAWTGRVTKLTCRWGDGTTGRRNGEGSPNGGNAPSNPGQVETLPDKCR